MAVQAIVVTVGRDLVGVAAAEQGVLVALRNDLVPAVHAVEPVLVALDEELVVVVVALRRNDTVAKLPRLPRETRRLSCGSVDDVEAVRRRDDAVDAN